jgi:hypothetical protein
LIQVWQRLPVPLKEYGVHPVDSEDNHPHTGGLRGLMGATGE